MGLFTSHSDDCNNKTCEVKLRGARNLGRLNRDYTIDASISVTPTKMTRASAGDPTSFISWGTSAAELGRQSETFCVDPTCPDGQRSFDYLQRNVGYAADQLEKVEQGEMGWEDVDSHVFRRVESLSEAFDESLGTLEDENAAITEAQMKQLEQQRDRLDQHLEGAIERTLDDTGLDQRYDPGDFSDPARNRIHHDVNTVTDGAGSRIENALNAFDSTGNILDRDGVTASNTTDEGNVGSAASDAPDTRDGEGEFDALNPDPEANAHSFADVDARLTGPECSDCGDHMVTTREYGQGAGSWVSGSRGWSTTVGTSYSFDLSDWKNPGGVSVEGPSLSVGKSAETDEYCTNPLCDRGLEDLSRFQGEIDQFTTDLEAIADGGDNWEDLDPDDARRIAAVADGYRDSVTRIDDRLDEKNFNVTETLRRFDHKMSDLDEALGDAIQETATNDLSGEEIDGIKRGDAQLDGLNDELGLTDRARNLGAEVSGRNIGVVGAIRNANDAVDSIETARRDVLGTTSETETAAETEVESAAEEEAAAEAGADSFADSQRISPEGDAPANGRADDSQREGDTDRDVLDEAETGATGAAGDAREPTTGDTQEEAAADRRKQSGASDSEDQNVAADVPDRAAESGPEGKGVDADAETREQESGRTTNEGAAETQPNGETEETGAESDSDALGLDDGTPRTASSSADSDVDAEANSDAIELSNDGTTTESPPGDLDAESNSDALDVSDDRTTTESPPGDLGAEADSDAVAPNGEDTEAPDGETPDDESTTSDESDAIAPETEPDGTTPSTPGERHDEDESEGPSIL